LLSLSVAGFFSQANIPPCRMLSLASLRFVGL
jgi:hypothetical protein